MGHFLNQEENVVTKINKVKYQHNQVCKIFHKQIKLIIK